MNGAQRRFATGLHLMIVAVTLPWLVANMGYWRGSFLAFAIGQLIGLLAVWKAVGVATPRGGECK